VKVYRITAPCFLNLKIERTKCPPWGLRGGKPGIVSEVEIRRAGGEVLHALKGNHALGPGDVVVVRTAGGGGFGPPWEREVSRVADDVSLGYVSRTAARDAYGVVIGGDGMVDPNATALLRSELSK